MTDFLVRRFVKDYEKTDNADVRTSYGIFVKYRGNLLQHSAVYGKAADRCRNELSGDHGGCVQ